MKKALILILALWVGTANFAYASARLECASMMNRPVASVPSAMATNKHACCDSKSVPCQCSIKTPSNDLFTPVNANIEKIQLPVSLQTLSVGSSLVSTNLFKVFSSKSHPESPPALFSILRI